jgi:hypothetical protein
MMFRVSLASVLVLSLFSCGSGKENGSDSADDNGPIASDQDGDGIIDTHEGEGDPDGDGIPNMLDEDSDGDCIPDSIERGATDELSLPVDSDHDEIYDFLDTDSDENGILDHDEAGDCEDPTDTDGDGVYDYASIDNDGDTISDVDDGFGDWDGDGIANHQDFDSDGDCIPDSFEAGDSALSSLPFDTDDDGKPDYLDLDADDDGVSDMEEADGACGTPSDLDGDGLLDHIDPDIDGDGLSNHAELGMGTNPIKRDSDGDGYTDGLEDFAETAALDPDHYPRGTIIEMGPRANVEEIDEYVFDNVKVDIFLLVDTAYSYSCYHPNIPDFVAQLIEHLLLVYEDLALGIGAYDDYAYSSWAASGGLPFKIVHQMSTDGESILEAAEDLRMVYGGDALGSAYEALYQAATGIGYDQNCNGGFDSVSDVQPFLASSDDAFDGAAGQTCDVEVEGTGLNPGVGFRTGSLPVFMLASDNEMRDPDQGDEVPPGACPGAVGSSDAVSAIRALNAKVLGINVYEYWSSDNTLLYQLTDLAEATNSYIDADDNGTKDDPAVLYGSWNWPPISDVVDAMWDLAEEYTFEGTMQVGEDDRNWLTYFWAESFTEIEPGEAIDFEFQLTTSAQMQSDDQFYRANIEIVDNRDEVIDTHWIWVQIVPNHRL